VTTAMYTDENQRDFARLLRTNATDAERQLWRILRCRQLKGFKFHRQAAIGKFVVDFVCFDRKLIIELDGGQHNEAIIKNYDMARTGWLESQEFRVIRFWNYDIFESEDSVAELIWKALVEAESTLAQPPSPALPTEGRESD
jgi:very-short-patch-repair endonuclease